jgi:hypothetical protein
MLKKLSRSFLFLIPAVAAVGVGLYAMAAQALPGSWTETFYYSDASFTQQVGYRFVSCAGATNLQGQSSNWFRQEQGSCTSDDYREPACFERQCVANRCQDIPIDCPY